QLVEAMGDWWDLRSHFSEASIGRTWALESALAVGDPSWECWARHDLAIIQRQLGAWREARDNLARALALSEETSDSVVICNVMRELALLNEAVGRMDEARSGHERACALARQADVQELVDRAEFDLAVLNSKTDRYDEARAGYIRVLPSVEARGD